MNKTLTALLLLGVTFSVITVVSAISAVPNPGHNISEIGGYNAVGDLLYGTDATNGGLSYLSDIATGNVLLSGGTNTAPAWGKVNLATMVMGNLATTSLNSGTGASATTYWRGDGTWGTPSGSGAPSSSTYITQTADAGLSGEQALSTLASGYMKVTTGTGVVTSQATPIPVADGGTGSTAGAPGAFLAVQTLTSGTTYTPTSGTTKAIVELWGGGGAGGSCTAVAGCAAGGGGAGGYAKYYFTGVGAGPYTIAIGAAGAAVAGATGGAGTATTFAGAVTVTANFGAGGTTAAGTAATKYTAGGAGGAISANGTVNGAGEPGQFGSTSATATIGASGRGGSTALGGAGVGIAYSSAAAVPGVAAVANTGSGGSGGGTGTATAAAGGAGAAGRIVVTEFR